SAAKAAPRSSAWPRAAMAAALALAVLLSASPAPAETPAGDTSRQSRDDSLRNIPFQKLTEPARQKIAYVVSNPSMFRRMPAKVIDCDPEMYLFLVRYP